MIVDIIVNIYDLVKYVNDVDIDLKLKDIKENYDGEFKYRYNFELKKYLLNQMVNNGFVFDNFLYLVDSMEIIDIEKGDVFDKYKIKLSI